MRLTTATTLALLSLLLLTSGPASAKTYSVRHQVVGFVPLRIHEQIGFIPIAGISPVVEGQSPGQVTIRAGAHKYRGVWAYVTVSRRTMTEALKYMRRDARGRYGVVDNVLFGDRRLTAAERRHFVELLDLARDADVLAVKAGHPACSGLTVAQARGIASGRITRWSEVTDLPAGQPDAIALRHTVVNESFEPRFGVSRRPRAARGAFDGGAAEASRNPAVAAVTSWSRVRFRRSVCAVPINEVAPSDASVHALSYPASYPITLVAVRKRQDTGYAKAVRREYLKFLRSGSAAELFKRNGLLMADETPSPAAQQPVQSETTASTGARMQDGQARPVTATRADDTARAALTGERIELANAGGFERHVFDSDGVLQYVEQTDTECHHAIDSWTLLEGWRYSEHGGGILARVRLDRGAPEDVVIDLPSAAPDTAYIDGVRHSRSRDLAATC